MKVKDLIVQLGKLDQDLEIYGYSEDESIATDDKLFRLFSVDHVDTRSAILSRAEDRSPQATFDSGPDSQKLALINMSVDF